MVTKKVVVEAAPKTRTYVRKTQPIPGNIYVLSERQKLFSWEPKFYFSTMEEARSAKIDLENKSKYGVDGWKMSVTHPYKNA